VERQRLDEKAPAAGDDALDLREGDAVIDGRLDRILLQRGHALHFELRVDIEALPQRFFLGVQAMTREKRAVLHPDRVGHVLFPSPAAPQAAVRALRPRATIASAMASASTLIATSCTLNSA